MKLVPAVVLLGFGSVGVGGWYKFSNLKPKTLRQYLEWQGLRLISDSESNYWAAVLDENKEVAKRLGISDSDIKGVKGWCQKHIDSENYEDLKDSASLLCVDNPRTVKARIIQLDGGTGKLISNSESEKYKVAYVFRKHIDGFHDLIGYKPAVGEDGKEVEELDKAKEAFQKWCEDSLKKSVDDTLVMNVRTLCTPKRFTTIKELIEQNGEKGSLLTETENQSELKKKYKEIQNLASWKKDKSGASSENDLKTWCTENQNKNFHEDKVFSEIYPKFRFRCLKASEASPKQVSNSLLP
ncbi:hypothetical protein HF1_10220 [Mycoplasma haemofelis str. Langford 1]|uniref:Uncharacterized protein n=1 Tax=Mycoplasma haemofelis (strain Langford 1) TaxID=941640 RepID=E8ZIQ9_MYCHL|nr:hypothetical protein [Mycoplasma haemofelis]CBY93030.1 hypothetical protein HF1_10220 [Mycoplasma haemofelis str. Langford 1]